MRARVCSAQCAVRSAQCAVRSVRLPAHAARHDVHDVDSASVEPLRTSECGDLYAQMVDDGAAI